MGKRIAGTCYVTYDGKPLQIAGSVTVSPEEFDRQSLSGLSGVAGFSETPRAAFIEVEAFTIQEMDLQEISRATDITVTAELANGQVWTLRNGWKAGTSDMSASDGTATIRFEGPKCERVK